MTSNWQKKSMEKHQFSKYKHKTPPTLTKSNTNDETSSNRGAPTPVIDVADSSDDRYSKRSLSSTWYGDESELEELDNEQLKAADFEILQKSGAGSHFAFSSEKQWEAEMTSAMETSSTYFTINLKLITDGLSTIPFYKRMDYDPSMFSASELKIMNNEAERMEKNYYEKVLKEYEQRKLDNPIKIKSRKSSAEAAAKTKRNTKSGANSVASAENKTQRGNSAVVSQNDDKDDELDELLNMTTDNNQQEKTELAADDAKSNENLNSSDVASANVDEVSTGDAEGAASKKEDIQEWLDGILDE